MPKKPTFTVVDRHHNPIGEQAYTPLIYIAGTTTHRFALHRKFASILPVQKQPWSISDPVSGAHIISVRGHYRGVPCSSAGFNQAEARKAAMHTLDLMLERVGSDFFNKTIEQAHQRELT